MHVYWIPSPLSVEKPLVNSLGEQCLNSNFRNHQQKEPLRYWKNLKKNIQIIFKMTALFVKITKTYMVVYGQMFASHILTINRQKIITNFPH